DPPLHRQAHVAANEQKRRLREGPEPYLDKVRRLMGRASPLGRGFRGGLRLPHRVSPLLRPVFLSPPVLKLRPPARCIRQVVFPPRGSTGSVGFQTLVAVEQQPLGLGVLLLLG